jgi:tetratricopeptide (TPR) repeat protein
LADTTAAEIEDAVFEEMPEEKPATSSVRTSTPPPAYYDNDDDIPELPGRGGSALRWLVLIVFVGALALIASQWDRVALLVGIGGDPALIAAGIAEGDAARAEGHPAAYANAIEAYGRAIEAGADTDPDVLARLSNAYSLAAQARLDDDASNEAVGELVAAALSTAEGATTLDTRDLEAKLALIDAQRLSGEQAAAREQLEVVRAASFSRTAEFFRVDARLSIAEADGRVENGLRSARQAAKLDPEGARYLLLLARTEIAAGHSERAREALDAVLANQPAHPVATKLSSELGAGEEPEVVADAGVMEQADAAAAADTETPTEEKAETPTEEKAETPEPEPAKQAVEAPPQKQEPAKKEAPPKPAASPKPKPKRPAPKKPQYDEYDRLAQAAGSDAFIDGRPPVLDYESNMKKGRDELAAGNYARARAYFDSALEVHPGSADAMDALGDVATAVSDYASAVRYYRVAAQRGHSDGYYKLGQTYERLGREEEAVSAYYTYIKRRPTGRHAAEARAAITALEPRAKLPPEPPADSESSEEPTAPPANAPTQSPPPETP